MLGFVYRVAVYFSPVLLANMEIGLDKLAKASEPSNLLAPSLAAAALGLFIPCFKPGAATSNWKKRMDQGAAGVALLGLLFTFYFWQVLVAANLGAEVPGWMPRWDWFGLGFKANFAILVYASAAFLAEAKAVVEK